MGTDIMPLCETDVVAVARKEEEKETAKANANAGAGSQAAGTLWFIGWLFTIGYVKLVWWKALLGIVLWPYFLGDFLRG